MPMCRQFEYSFQYVTNFDKNAAIGQRFTLKRPLYGRPATGYEMLSPH